MIKDIKVLNRTRAELLCYGLETPKNKWVLISICSDKQEQLVRSDVVKNQLKKWGCLSWLSLTFDDITMELYEKVKKVRPDVIANLFSKKDAKLIIDFIKKHKDSKKDLTLITHCQAGVSRSGAVGWFACNFLGIDKTTFLQTNRTLFPNKYILQILESLSGINPTSKEEYEKHFKIIDF
jgi:predicted protein tyrosine phosphatase